MTIDTEPKLPRKWKGVGGGPTRHIITVADVGMSGKNPSRNTFLNAVYKQFPGWKVVSVFQRRRSFGVRVIPKEVKEKGV